MPVVRIILESGLINVAYLFTFVLVVEFGSQAFELMCDMVSSFKGSPSLGSASATAPRSNRLLLQGVSLTGIVFTIVILRAGLRRHDATMYTTKHITFPWKITNISKHVGLEESGDLQFAAQRTVSLTASSETNSVDATMPTEDFEFRSRDEEEKTLDCAMGLSA